MDANGQPARHALNQGMRILDEVILDLGGQPQVFEQANEPSAPATREAIPGDQSHDPQFEQLAGNICARPEQYVNPATFGTVCAYLGGFDDARSGGPLIGFRQWLVVRANTGDNLYWSALARHQLIEDVAEVGLPEEERAIRGLGRLLAEFFEDRRSNGITKMFHEYAKWLLRRSWYTGPLRRNPSQET